MKVNVNAQDLDFIQNVIKTANMLNITGVIIEPGKVRATNEEQTIFLFQDKNMPSLPFGSIGINRLDAFNTRLEIVRSRPQFSVEVTTMGVDNNIGYDVYDPASSPTPPMWVRSVDFNAERISMGYRCANPQTIKAPKKCAGSNLFSVDITPELISMLQKGKVAMKAKEVTLIGDKKGASVQISDINSDTLSYHFNDNIVSHTGTPPEFSYTYIIDELLPIFKTNPIGTFRLTAKGALSFNVNGLDVIFISYT